MDADLHFIDPDNVPASDYVVTADEVWECPCGYFRNGPCTVPAFAQIYTECPHCRTSVTVMAEVVR